MVFEGARIAAVVPAYNEAKMIATVIETMPHFVDHIIVVDDCSSDGTSDVVQASADERVVLVRHETNKGVGGAIITGHRKAMALGADVNVIMAGDAQMDPDYLPPLLEQVTTHGYGFAKANRFFAPESFHGMPRYRVFGNIVLSFMTKFASGYWHLFDPQNGYTAIRTEVLRRLDLDRIAPRYSFENDLLIRLNILQVPAVDVPIPAVYGNEVSSIRLSKVVPELLTLLTVGFWRRIWYRYVLWSFSPIALLLVLGLLLSGFGLAVAIWVCFQIAASVVATAATVMLAAVPLMVGAQMLIGALQLDIQASPSTPSGEPFERTAPR
ncbi:glycosyltransferase family 2 protein [Xylanimonas ulmi]|uniref:GT2 family glycosyltransferase n=1 Tax=Xylanimonas ulmi TaxID=228973 RepID=A0A4Q7LZF4_9MICO|nr:glycosyltransferase family 2 protein [Xylanibacterium ulmi]RZS59943.1 GT2 family glycosyltransferase [Xylanibacterium ulmi]